MGKINFSNIKSYKNVQGSKINEKPFTSEYQEIDYDTYDASTANTNLDSSQTKIDDKAWYEVALATGAVGTTSIASGVFKIGEYALDGLTWANGMIRSGFYRLFGDKATAEKIQMETQDIIATDMVGEMNKLFYEKTRLGQIINDTSALKYDSKVASKIQNITTDVGEFAAATAITIATGGTAAPLVFGLGAISGIGESAESIYQGNENLIESTIKLLNPGCEIGTKTSSLLDNASILLGGGLTGLSWMANGKLGSGFVEIGKSISTLGGKATTKNLINLTIKNKDFLKTNVKEALWSKSAIGNYLGAGMQLGGDLTPYISGAKEVNGKAVTSLVGKYIFYLGLNVGEDILRAGVNDYSNKLKKLNSIKIASRDIFELTRASKGSYGVDQAAVRRLLEFKINNLDWLDDQNKFRDFLLKRGAESGEVDSFINGLQDNSTVASIAGRDLILEYLQDNSKLSTEDLLDKALDIFSIKPTEEFTRINQKLISYGLSEEDAIKVMSAVDSTGVCTYADVANVIVSTFADKSEIFKKNFKFDLFNPDGTINSSELLLDMYININSTSFGGLLFEFSKDGTLKIKSLDTSNQQYLSSFFVKSEENSLVEQYLKSKNSQFNYARDWTSYISFKNTTAMYELTSDGKLGIKVKEKFTSQDIKTLFTDALKTEKNVELDISSRSGRIEFVNENGNVFCSTDDWKEGDGHAVYVTGITDDSVIVSSWGRKLMLKFDDFVEGAFGIRFSEIGGVE